MRHKASHNSNTLHKVSHSNSMRHKGIHNSNMRHKVSHSKGMPHNRVDSHKADRRLSRHRKAHLHRTRSQALLEPVLNFKESASALFLEHYGEQLRSGYKPSEAKSLVLKDWLKVAKDLNTHDLDLMAATLLEQVNEEGKRLSKDKTTHLERLKLLQAVRITLIDLLGLEEPK